MARVVHFEISANQPEKVVRFYRDVFDWKIEQHPGGVDYWTVRTGPEDKDGIDGGIFRPNEWFSGTVNTIEVDDLDASLKRVKAHGGEQVVDKMPIPELGMLAYCKDVEGTIFGLLERGATS
jgi:predicted enzyme related to lactoylglutathione lyase